MEYIEERGLRWLPESSWQPVLQRSTDAFYEGNLAEGADACLTLLNAVGVPDNIRELTYRNQIYYAQPLHEMVPGTTWPPLVTLVPEGWTTRDPSPVVIDYRLAIFLRAVRDQNGTEINERELPSVMRVESGPTELVILRDTTDDGFRLTEIRPFVHTGTLQASAIVRTVSEGDRVCAGVLTLSDSNATPLVVFGPRYGDFRQGWSPFVTQDGPCFVGWWEPTEVFRLIPSTNDFDQVALHMAPHIAERFRGGSAGVVIPGGYLFLINETAIFDDGTEVNLSRFVRVNDGFQIVDISPQFYVTERGQDSATGLARLGDLLIAGFTCGSSQSRLVSMELEAVLRVLIPVAAPGRQVSAAVAS